MGLYRRERTGKGSHVTTSLLASGVWACGVPIQGALSDARFSPNHDRTNPSNPGINTYRAADGRWFVLVVEPSRWPALATALGRADLLSDPRFSTPARIATNAAQLTAILDAMFAAQPIAHWRELFERTRVTFSVVREPQEVVEDLQLAANDVIVPVEGGADGLRRTISCPIQVHDVTKVPARRAPGIGEHSDEILGQLGFDAARIAQLHASGAVPAAAEHRG
jgi:formyl-CoA transferase